MTVKPLQFHLSQPPASTDCSDPAPRLPTAQASPEAQAFQAALYPALTASTPASALALPQSASTRFLIPALSAGAAALGGGLLAMLWPPALGQREVYTVPGTEEYRITLMASERGGRLERRDSKGNWFATIVEMTPVYALPQGPAHGRELMGFVPLSPEDARQLEQLPRFPTPPPRDIHQTPFPAASDANSEPSEFPQTPSSAPVLPGRAGKQATLNSTAFPVTDGAEAPLKPMLQEKTEVNAEQQVVSPISIKEIEDVIKSASRPARSGSQDSRAVQALKKKIDRGIDAFSGLPKTEDVADELIRQTLGAKNPTVRTKMRNGEIIKDIFDPSTGRGVRLIDGKFDTFVNLK